ncbi:MAG TPA: glycosyltransferase, partial [Candidatus Polarisedimenticolaceae bacterium]|nr:glycosyltransferase [Candidatus Polarisedimenticolaceae bacterium]
MARIPRVSVLLPVRNAEGTLEACLRSIVRQTEADWECWAVDDGSTDGSAERLRRWATLEPRLRWLAAPRP